MKLKLLKNKNYSLLIAGKFISMIGSNMQQFALSLYVYSVTGSAAIFASMVSIAILPRILLSPIAGVFGDWFDRKKMIVLLDFINGMSLAVFAYIFMMNQSLNLGLIYALIIILEAGEIFYESSSAGIIPSIVEKDDLLEAKSLSVLIISIGRLLSPMLAAVIYGLYGLLFILILNSISFLVSSFSELFITVPKNHKKPDQINVKSFFVDLKEGFKIIKENKFISTIIYLGTICNFVVAPFFTVGFIVIIKNVLQASDLQFGIYQTVIGLSMISAPILVSSYIKRFDIAKVCYLAFTTMGLLIIIMAFIASNVFLTQFSSNLVPYVILMVLSFIVGMVVGVINITIGTLFATVVPLHAMGRTSSVMNLMVVLFIPVGQLLFGFMYDFISVSYVIIMSGSILLIGVFIFKNTLLASTKETEEKLPKKGALVHEV
jgi:MFS family permease